MATPRAHRADPFERLGELADVLKEAAVTGSKAEARIRAADAMVQATGDNLEDPEWVARLFANLKIVGWLKVEVEDSETEDDDTDEDDDALPPGGGAGGPVTPVKSLAGTAAAAAAKVKALDSTQKAVGVVRRMKIGENAGGKKYDAHEAINTAATDVEEAFKLFDKVTAAFTAQLFAADKQASRSSVVNHVVHLILSGNPRKAADHNGLITALADLGLAARA